MMRQSSIWKRLLADCHRGPGFITTLDYYTKFLKQNPKAEDKLLRALALYSDSFDFIFALADHYIKTSELNKTKEFAQKMVLLYPQNKTGKDILIFIEQMEKQLHH